MIINFNKCESIDQIIDVILFPNTSNVEYRNQLKDLLKGFSILDREKTEDSIYLGNKKIKIKFRKDSSKELTEYLIFDGKQKGGKYLPEYWNNKRNSIKRVINFLKSNLNAERIDNLQ